MQLDLPVHFRGDLYELENNRRVTEAALAAAFVGNTALARRLWSYRRNAEIPRRKY
jgi:hypothetical protein